MKAYEFSDWIESSGGPLVVIEKHLAPLWGGTNGNPSDFDLACDTVNYVELVSTRSVTALVLGDEPLRTIAAHSDGHTLIVRWRWATSEQDVLKAIQSIKLPSTYEEHLDIVLPSGTLAMFDSATQYSETGVINLKTHAGKNAIQTFTYSPNPEMNLLIHKISKSSGKLRAVKSNQ